MALSAIVALTAVVGCSYDDSAIWDEFKDLKQDVAQNRADIEALTALVDALSAGKVITNTAYTDEGVVLTFNDGTSALIKNGKDGIDGTPGKDGVDGAPGKDGVDGAPGKDGDSMFESIEETEDEVIITLTDGRVIRLPKATADEGEEPENPEENEPSEELDYQLRILTFEDADSKFEPYLLDYVDMYTGKDIYTWSDLIDSKQYSGPMLYGNDAMDAMYYWYDENNTELYHMFPDNYAYCYWGGGHAISNYWGEGYADEDRNTLIAKYYGADYVEQWAGKPGADAALGWFLLQLTTPVPAHSGDNFCVHYGYKDDYSFIENLPEWSFADGEARVIDHMWVTNTNYTLNQLYNGVKSEEGNSFGGNWTGLTDDAWLKIVAYGYASIDDDEPCSEVEFYLVKGHEVVEDWQKWELHELGAVERVVFNFLYSEEMGGKYGFTIPGYFAYDDVAVRFPKE